MTIAVIGDNTGDDFSGTEDVHIYEAAATTNQDTNGFDIGKYAAASHRNGLIRFTGISSLPSSLTVSSATLNLYLYTAGVIATHTFDFRKVLRAWGETTATWNTYDGSNSWTTAGGLSSGNDIAATVTGTMSVPRLVDTWMNFSSAQLAADVEDFADGTLTNDGWHVERTDGANDSAYRVFREHDGTDGQRPYLSITYTVAGNPTGSGALQAATSDLTGAGVSSNTFSGTLQSLTATLAGAGESIYEGSAALVAQTASTVGSGIEGVIGSGALQASTATTRGFDVAAPSAISLISRLANNITSNLIGRLS